MARWHYIMINDIKRNSAFKEAIDIAVGRGHDSVLDIGSGSGLLRSVLSPVLSPVDPKSYQSFSVPNFVLVCIASDRGLNRSMPAKCLKCYTICAVMSCEPMASTNKWFCSMRCQLISKSLK